jgi:DNA-binding transcriptional LysR family regulator
VGTDNCRAGRLRWAAPPQCGAGLHLFVIGMTPFTSVLQNIELRLFRYAIAVAEELHFTRASSRLHLATPSLSRQIRQLEETLGYQLFERTTRAIALTPAGVAFVAEARRVLAYAQRAVDAGAIAAANDDTTDVVRVGYTPLMDGCQVRHIRELLSQADRSATIVFQSSFSLTQVDQILSGYLDAGFVVLPIAPGTLRTALVFRDRLVAAVPDKSKLAAHAVLSASQFSGQPVVWFGRLANPHLYQHLVESCRQAGFTPSIIHEVSTITEMLEVVARGDAVGFVKGSVQSQFRPQGVTFREVVRPELTLDIGFAYDDKHHGEKIGTFVDLLQQLRADGSACGPSAINRIAG